MPICDKCGTQFEGKFCPECGEEYKPEKTCPKCGATVPSGTKFCAMCGYSFYKEEKSAQPAAHVAAGEGYVNRPVKVGKVYDERAEQTYTKVHRIINFAPAILFAVFAIALFAFFFAPMAVTPSLLGDEPGESFGNLYDFFGSGGLELPLKGCAAAAMFFALTSLPLAAVIALMTFSSVFRYKKVSLAGRGVPVGYFAECAGWLIYLSIIIISASVYGAISAADGGMGLAVAGACPALMLSFAVIFLTVSVACRLFDWLFILKNFPKIADIGKPAPLKYFKACPAEVEKPKKEDSPLCKQEVLMKQSRAYARASAIAPLGIIIMGIFDCCVITQSGLRLIVMIIIQLLMLAVSIRILVEGCKVFSGYLDNVYSAKKAGKFLTFLIILTIIESIITIYLSCADLFLGIGLARRIMFGNVRTYLIFSVCFSVVFIMLMIICLVFCGKAKSLTKKANMLLYGSKKATKKPTEFGKKFLEENAAYEKSVFEYKAYVKQMNNWLFEKAMCESGFDYNDKKKRAAFWISVHKGTVCLIALGLIAAFVLIVSLTAGLTATPTVEDILTGALR